MNLQSFLSAALLAALLPSCQSDNEKLCEAIRGNQLPVVEACLSDPEAGWKHGYTNAFALACARGSYECVRLMLEQGDVLHGPDMKDPTYWAGAYIRKAMENPDKRVLDMLMKHDMARDKKALSHALCWVSDVSRARMLLDAGADPLLLLDVQGIPDFCALTRIDDTACFKYVLSRLNVPALTEAQKSLLAKAVIARPNSTENLSYLFEHGLSPETRIEGKSLYGYAMEWVPFEMIDVPRDLECGLWLKKQGYAKGEAAPPPPRVAKPQP